MIVCFRYVVPSAMLFACLGSGLEAQVAPVGRGFQAEFLAELTVSEDHLIRLAEAIPDSLYAWIPAPGVRSVSEVLLHVAGSNFNLPRVLGIAQAEGMVGSGYDRSMVPKAEVLAALVASFRFLRAAIEKLTLADAGKRIPWFDGETTYRGVLYFMARHTGEHTGQLIAYARVNGIVPPWSGERSPPME